MESHAPYSKLEEAARNLCIHPAKLEDTQSEKVLSRRMTQPERASMTCGMYLLVGVASFGGFLFGYDTGVISGAMIEIKQ
eukprot:1134588-Amphidinium_carterae.1